MKDGWIEIAVSAIGFGLLIAVGYFVSSYQCKAKWEHSGMIPHYGLQQGCQLEKQDGTWIPAENYRGMP